MMLYLRLLCVACLRSITCMAAFYHPGISPFLGHVRSFQGKKQVLPNDIFGGNFPVVFSTPTSDGEDVANAVGGGEGSSTKSKEDLSEAEQIGNLVADDEWAGFSLELSEMLRCAVVEDLKRNTREFIGKDDYKIGDISKEVDARVKDEVAKLRDKDEYELGDLSLALDKISKDISCELSGKAPGTYEFGDLSKEIDRRIKKSVETFTGKPYEAGDLTREVSRRVSEAVQEFTGKDYEFGDITREVERRRSEWVKDYLGKDDYVFGDVTKKAVKNFTGKSEYEFGDLTKSVMGKMFGKRKRGGGGGSGDPSDN